MTMIWGNIMFRICEEEKESAMESIQECRRKSGGFNVPEPKERKCFKEEE